MYSFKSKSWETTEVEGYASTKITTDGWRYGKMVKVSAYLLGIGMKFFLGERCWNFLFGVEGKYADGCGEGELCFQELSDVTIC